MKATSYSDGNVEWKLRPVAPGVWEATLTVRRLHPGTQLPLKRVALAPDKASAVEQAVSQVAAIAKNPVLQAVMPPGTSNAIAAVGMVAKAAKAGQLGKVFSKLKGPGAKRLAKALIPGW
jgi:hypothetical protein